MVWVDDFNVVIERYISRHNRARALLVKRQGRLIFGMQAHRKPFEI